MTLETFRKLTKRISGDCVIRFREGNGTKTPHALNFVEENDGSFDLIFN